MALDTVTLLEAAKKQGMDEEEFGERLQAAYFRLLTNGYSDIQKRAKEMSYYVGIAISDSTIQKAYSYCLTEIINSGWKDHLPLNRFEELKQIADGTRVSSAVSDMAFEMLLKDKRMDTDDYRSLGHTLGAQPSYELVEKVIKEHIGNLEFSSADRIEQITGIKPGENVYFAFLERISG